MSIMNPWHMERFSKPQSYGSEAHKINGQSSGFQTSTPNDQSFVKTVISLTGMETCRGRSHIGGLSGRRLLFGGALFTHDKTP